MLFNILGFGFLWEIIYIFKSSFIYVLYKELIFDYIKEIVNNLKSFNPNQMKFRNIILLIITVLTFTSCMFSYKKGTDVKMKKKTIDGVEYTFINRTQSVTKRVGLLGGSKLDNIIDFTGLDKPVHKTISKSEFSKKVEIGNAEIFIVDSLSFVVNNSRDRVDLCYYIDLGFEKKQAMFTLEKNNGNWKLN